MLFRLVSGRDGGVRLTWKPVSVSKNIFKFMRLDYVWRLNYRDHPGIQKRGIRCTMSLSF